MSFLGYIGRSLGAGSAPIAAGLKTAQADIDYREYRDDAPNRQRARELQIRDLERAERTAVMTEEERNRRAEVAAGLRVNAPMVPNYAEDLPDTVASMGTYTPAAPAGLAPPIGAATSARTAPAVLAAPSTGVVASSAPAAVAAPAGITRPEAAPGFPVPMDPNAQTRRIREIDARIKEIRDATRSQRGLTPTSEPIVELNELQRERRRLTAPSAQTMAPSPATGVPEMLAAPAAAALTAPAPAAADPTAAPAPAASTRAASPAATPAEAARNYVTPPTSVKEINRDVYLNDPEKLSLDLQLSFFMFEALKTRAEQDLQLANRLDETSIRDAVDRARAQENQMVELSGVISKLQGMQGLRQAEGGDVRLLNAVLSGATNRLIEWKPVMNEETGDVFFQKTVGNRDIGVPVSYDALVDNTLEEIDAEYAREARLMRTQANIQAQQAEIDFQKKVFLLDRATANDIRKLIADRELETAQEILKNRLRMTEQEANQFDFNSLGTDNQGNPIIQDRTGAVFSIQDVTQRIDRRDVTVTTARPVVGIRRD
jgi:hypothetical protein